MLKDMYALRPLVRAGGRKEAANSDQSKLRRAQWHALGQQARLGFGPAATSVVETVVDSTVIDPLNLSGRKQSKLGATT